MNTYEIKLYLDGGIINAELQYSFDNHSLENESKDLDEEITCRKEAISSFDLIDQDFVEARVNKQLYQRAKVSLVEWDDEGHPTKILSKNINL